MSNRRRINPLQFRRDDSDLNYDENDGIPLSMFSAFQRNDFSLHKPRLGKNLFLNSILSKVFPNVIPSVVKTPLYRIETLENVLYMLEKKQMKMSTPSSWDDPWEDMLWRTTEVFTPNLRSRVSFLHYAQCWSRNPECWALWHERKGKGRTIRIKSSVERLLQGIYCDDVREFDVGEQFYLRDVIYMSNHCRDMLYEKLNDPTTEDPDDVYDFDECCLALLFVKRKAFQFEREVRLVWREPTECHTCHNASFISVSIDPKTVIQSVQVDPWCGPLEYEMIADKMRLYNIPCIKSDLNEQILRLFQKK